MAVSAEHAVRTYLHYRKDPDTVVGQLGTDRVAPLRERLEESDDPLERLRLRAEIERATDPAVLEDAFVSHAKTWAEEHGVSPQAFASEGVPREVLQRAGLTDGESARRRRVARGRVTADEIRAAVPTRGRKFTISDLQDVSGGSGATVRKVLSDMVAAGEVEDLGPAPRHTGPGRSPRLYKRAPRR